MNANDLVALLNDLDFLQKQDSKILEQLTAKYPYFFLPHALLAKQKSLDQPPSQQQLNAAALLAGNRELLYYFMQEKYYPEKIIEREKKEKKVVPVGQRELSAAETDNEELLEMLKTIHERKLAFLNSDDNAHEERVIEEKVPDVSSEIESSDQYELSEASIADSEFPMNNILMEEESQERGEAMPSEIDAMHELDSAMSEQTEFDLQENLIFTNEISGAGAEFIPTDFLNREDANEDFALEPDAEIQSLNEMEEEIVFHERNFQETEKETEIFDSPLRMESENMVSFENEKTSYKEVGSENTTENENISEALNSDFEAEQETGRADDKSLEDDSLRINEEVSSPGEFLPDKSYTYSEWLRFFKSDSSERKTKASTEEKKESRKPAEAERTFGAAMELELESIDRIVSTINAKAENAKKEISPEELAKKSLELKEDIVSETLAQIYEEQGRYDKAIRQYVKLSLIYPEKVSFFAARIKELKGKK